MVNGFVQFPVVSAALQDVTDGLGTSKDQAFQMYSTSTVTRLLLYTFIV
jgi:hypothetical protein